MRTLDENYYESALISYLMKIGTISQPSVKHNDPADFGLIGEEAIKMRIRYLKGLKSPLEAELSDKKGRYLRGENEFGYIMINSLQDRIDKLSKAIHFNKERLKGNVVNQPFDLEVLKKVPIDSITKVNSNGFFQVNPFRQENSPSNSLFLYRKDNRAHDFGSGKSYDAIDVFMAVNQCDFKTACKEMSSIT
jgi:hypothetical protein